MSIPLTVILDTLAAYLQSQRLGTVGVNIFKGGLRDIPEKQIALIMTGGVKIPGDPLRRPTFQVLVRDSEYNVGLVRAQDVYNSLDRAVFPFLLQFGRVVARSEPGIYYRDANNKVVFSLNFQVILEP